MNDVEKDKLIEGLKRNAFSLSNTAKDLGMSRTTLWRKLKKFNDGGILVNIYAADTVSFRIHGQGAITRY